MMLNGRFLSNVFGFFLVVGVITLTGCGTEIIPDDTDDDQDTTPAASTLKIRLENQTDMEVDPHLYISTSNVGQDKLFTSEYIYSNFYGQTTLNPGQTVTIELNCDEIATLGSDQAEFGDTSTWTGGISEESPVIVVDETQENPGCGDMIELRFSKDDSTGTYHTNWRFGDPDLILAN